MKFILRSDEGWCQQNVVPFAAIYRTPHWVAQQTVGERSFFDSRMQLQGWSKGRFAISVEHHLDTPKKTASTNVANVWMVFEVLFENVFKRQATVTHFR